MIPVFTTTDHLMKLPERVADFLAASAPGDAIALSSDGDVETGTGVLLRHHRDGFCVELCYRQELGPDVQPGFLVAEACAALMCRVIGVTLDS